ncbi:hypothetical protein L202_01507 [Cryptococcus amylolentus CBS 6039]|uniref:Uncharacterized protein n=1 Tax=Cryptococcus amylolentus CBS 6039 TaxID=1295533 RepID=A0A1E3I482_9TREE|nr:hypothetical protein L202_01507 [Cryptococcus amylolentus CBS 6039]ODN83348.1 hypothetical protein L202_01507 [Cryptococcus amylolentus CBS 6039]
MAPREEDMLTDSFAGIVADANCPITFPHGSSYDSGIYVYLVKQPHTTCSHPRRKVQRLSVNQRAAVHLIILAQTQLNIPKVALTERGRRYSLTDAHARAWKAIPQHTSGPQRQK